MESNGGGLTQFFLNPLKSLKVPPQGKILMLSGVLSIKTTYQRYISAYFLSKSHRKKILFSKIFGDDLRMEGDRPWTPKGTKQGDGPRVGGGGFVKFSPDGGRTPPSP